jgi:DNA-binding MarR family transcriptional regulator
MSTVSPPAPDTPPELEAIYRVMGMMCALFPGMPSQRLQCLLYVLGHPGCTSRDLMAAVNIRQSSVSRNMAVLGDKGWLDQRTGERSQGLGLVEARPDPEEPRRLAYYPTGRGEIMGEFIHGVFSEHLNKPLSQLMR